MNILTAKQRMKAIYKRAEEINMSHAEISRRTGIKKGNLSSYFSGRLEPGVSILIKIERALVEYENQLREKLKIK